MTATGGERPRYRVTVAPAQLEGHLEYELARAEADGSWVPLEPLRTPACTPAQALSVALHWLRMHHAGPAEVALADVDFAFLTAPQAPSASGSVRY